jgi:hypothetical protein
MSIESGSKVHNYSLDMIEQKSIVPIERLKRQTQVPLLSELDEATKNHLLAKCFVEQPTPSKWELDDMTMECDERIKGLLKGISKRETKKQHKLVKRKYDQIINGFYEDEIEILVNAETRHLI